jgi:DNA-binding CsgD family transcriptional regulator
MLQARHRLFGSPGLGQHWSAREIRRFAALASDASHSAPFDLAELWHPLCGGQLQVVDTFFSPERCLLVVCPQHGRSLSYRRRQVLERVLLGSRPKVLSADLGLSPSSVSGALAQSLKGFGLSTGTLGLPLVLVLAARAALKSRSFEGRASTVSTDGVKLTVVSVARPDWHVRPLLSTAEFDVIGHVLEGKTHQQIADIRKSSMRTIANQIASAYRKLGASGRIELMYEVARLAETSLQSFRSCPAENGFSQRGLLADGAGSAANAASASVGSGG